MSRNTVTLFLICLLSLNHSSYASSEDEVDIQWSICDGTPQQILKQLSHESGVPDKINQMTYFDSLPVTFAQKGISLRTKGQPGAIESSIKIRFIGPMSPGIEGECSWDRYGVDLNYTCVVSSRIQFGQKEIWSYEQQRFVEKFQHVDWDLLKSYGPFQNPKWKVTVSGYKAIFDSVETGPLHLMELSVKVKKSNEKSAFDAISTFLAGKGVGLCKIQEGKTLRHFRSLGIYP